MRRMLAAVLLLCTLLSVCLCGCGTFLERSYASVEPHQQFSRTDADEEDALNVETYQGLVSAILYLVEQQAPVGTIHLNHYDGNAYEDLVLACREVQEQSPLGAYAVENIRSKCRQVVAYFWAELTFTYRRTPEQVAAVVPAQVSAAVRQELEAALRARQEELVLETNLFSGGTAAEYEALTRELWLELEGVEEVPEPNAEQTEPEQPEAGSEEAPESEQPAEPKRVAPPLGVTVNLYPESGTIRYVEFLLDYDPAEEP